MQNIYSPNRFYLTFPHDNSWSFDRILNLLNKRFYTNIWFLSQLCEVMSFLPTIIMIIIINVNSFPERFFEGFQLIVFANKRAFMKKTALHTIQCSCVQCSCINLHTTTVIHCKARHDLRNLFSANQWNGSGMTYVAGATKIDLKNLKT